MHATWPYTARWTAALPRVIGEARPPQQSISGAETVIPAMGARWEVTGSFVIHGEQQELAWQAFIAQMEGGIGTTLVPIWSRFRPRTAAGLRVDWDNTAGLYGAQTFEHFGFEASPIIGARLAAPAALRATQITIELLDSTGIRPGQYFSIGERLHQVQHHWQVGGVRQVMIRPPLRVDAPAGTALELFRPVCLMRLAEPAGEFEYTPDLASRVTCRFVEDATSETAGAGTAAWTSGAGTPEGVVTAPIGSLYTRTDGTAAGTLYVKESGTGNTGWVAK